MNHSQSDRASARPQEIKITHEPVHAADVDRVADWIESLVCFIDAQREEPCNHRVLDRLYTDLEAKTESCLAHTGDIEMTVLESFLLFEGSTVYPRGRRPDSLPRALFGDGLRGIAVRRGLEAEELRAFVDVIRRATDDGLQGPEDVVALLWEQDFRHIDYVHVPLEELEMEVGTDGRRDAGGTGDGDIPWPSEAPPGEEAPEPGEPVEERSDDWVICGGLALAADEKLRMQFEFTDTEAKNILMVAGFEEVAAPPDQVFEIISTILSEEDRPDEFLEIATVVARLIEQALIEGNPVRANSMAARLRGIAADKTTARTEIRAAAEQVLGEVGRPEFLGRIAPVLNAHPEIDPSELVSLLVQLGPSAAPTLCDLLCDLTSQKIRRAVCEALAISCANDVEILIHRLSDSRWYVVRNILFVLGRIGHQGVERALGEALYHEDARVRREAIRALGGIQTPTSRAYLNFALRDPDKSVRILVAQTIAIRRDERAAHIVWCTIESPEFAGRDPDERAAFFQAFGRVGSDALVPRLERILTRGSSLTSGADEGRLDAAAALAWLGTPAALAILRRESKSMRAAIRVAVQEALASVRKVARKR